MHQVQQHTRRGLTAANVITCGRILLAAALSVCALRDEPRAVLGVLAAVALASDFVDGRLARATGTTTRLGARLDQEADALLILVLSAIVASDLGAWTLTIGLARYVFGAAFVLLPVLRTPPTRPRPWCRTVAALTGLTLAAVAALPMPHLVATGAVVVVAALLAESFLHEAVDRWRAPRQPVVVRYGVALPFLAVWAGLALAGTRGLPVGDAWLRPPVEALALVAVALLPLARTRAWLAGTVGSLIAVLALLAGIDLGFRAVLDRQFDPVADWSLLGSGVGVLADSIGAGWARAVTVVVLVLAAAVLGLLALASRRVVEALARHRRRTLRGGAALALLGVGSAVTGLPVVSVGAAARAAGEVRLIRADVADQRIFAREIAHDRYGGTPAASLLSGLAGKDVLLVFAESYGRVAVQGTSYSVGVDRVLRSGTDELRRAGYDMRSAFLTSPTFGGGSWLAHSTLQSGVWVDSQRRYRQLLGTHRATLTSLFGAGGWHTVFDVPADTEDWPQGKTFYGFAQYADSRNVGYAGPTFGYAPVPDQYTLAWLQRSLLSPRDRTRVFAEVDLVSSHHPWTPLPRMVRWDQVGDGSVYRTMPQTPTAQEVFRDPATVRTMYGRSIEYTWQALTSFLLNHPDPDLVVIVVGDHQPHSYVSGPHPGHDVPISFITRDPAVMAQIARWNWQSGLQPQPDAPVWRMDLFRDRFLAAFRAR